MADISRVCGQRQLVTPSLPNQTGIEITDIEGALSVTWPYTDITPTEEELEILLVLKSDLSRVYLDKKFLHYSSFTGPWEITLSTTGNR